MLECQQNEIRDFGLCHLEVSAKPLEKCLTHSKCSINIFEQINEWVRGKGQKKRQNLDGIKNCLAKQMFLSDFQRLKEILENVNTPPILWPPDAKSRLIRKLGCWERLKARGERDDREWDGWMPILTQWTWVWASSGRWWNTGKPGVLQSMGSQGVNKT